MPQGKTMVVKLGTSVLTGDGPRLDQAHMMELVRRCVRLRRDGHRIILVSSGAIAAGRERLGRPALPPTVASKQMLAAVGQIQLIQTWERLFSIYGLHIGQMLLTRADLEDRERFLNARDMLQALLENGIIPVINENDAVATAEIKVGDNDNLSALAAILADADLLLLLTDQEGLYTADPRSHPEARLIPVVERIDEAVHRLAGDSGSRQGTGGMITKIQAAQVAVRAGVAVVIAAGARPGVLEDVLAGRSAGTFFPAEASPLERRKRWLYGAPPAGDLTVDAGAVTALTEGKRSLLPKGIARVAGAFSRGEVVRILDPSGGELARGVTRYNSDALELIAGRHSAEIRTVLGYAHGPVAVHRNDLILTGDLHGH
jgi:glutamate 5-kinase